MIPDVGSASLISGGANGPSGRPLVSQPHITARVAPDGGTEVKRGQNVAEIKQNGSELKGNEGKDSI